MLRTCIQKASQQERNLLSKQFQLCVRGGQGQPRVSRIYHVQQQQARHKATTTRGQSSTLKKRNLSTRVLEQAPPATRTPLPEVSWELLLPVIGNTAYLALASGFLMTDMLQLRVLLVGGYTGLVTFHALHKNPLQIPLRWSALFVLVNAGAVALLVADRYGAPLAEEDEALYSSEFAKCLTRGQFYQLLQMSERVDLPQGTVLTQENKVCRRIYFLEQGQARVYHGHSSAIIEQGGFVNDVAFQRSLSGAEESKEEGAYGTVIASQDTQALVWDIDVLRDHLASNPEMERNIKYCLSDHLVKSLLRQRDATHMRQRSSRLQQLTMDAEEGTPTYA